MSDPCKQCPLALAGVDDDDDLLSIGLAANPILQNLARRAGLTVVEATRFLYRIAHAPPEHGDLLIAWLRREQIRQMRRAKARRDAQVAVIAAARRRTDNDV